MWISGIYVLSKQVGLSKDDFINKDIFKIFQLKILCLSFLNLLSHSLIP